MLSSADVQGSGPTPQGSRWIEPCAPLRRVRNGASCSSPVRLPAGRHLGREARMDHAARGPAYPSRSESAGPCRAGAGGEVDDPRLLRPPPPFQSDLVSSMTTKRGTRRRAALALGRVGLPEAVPALQQVLAIPMSRCGRWRRSHSD